MWGAGGRTAPGPRAVIASTATAILGYLRALAWPVIVAGVLVSVFRRYGSKLGNIIDRLRSEEPPLGLQVGLEPAQRSSVTDQEAETLINQKAPELVSTVIESLQAEHTVELGQAEQQAHDVIDRLLRKLATSEIRARFESIYARIYGSQVAALRTLREASNGAPRASVEAHLAQVKNDVSTRLVVWLQSLSFEEWFGYLEQQGLAEVGVDQRYHLTTMGAGFLAYIEGLGYARKSF
jgi:hypothetical protein